MSSLQDFDVGDVIGVGTVGTIYAARDRSTEQLVAIKKLHEAAGEDPLIRARFRREMLVLARMDHPNIVHFYGGGEDDGCLFYVMELVDGGTVKDLLESKGAFRWPVVADISRQVCSALQCAHNNGVVHRDLKPGNLFLTRQGEVKLGDFGVARDLHGEDITASGMTVGTHAYMAPEQITGDDSLSGKADLYSLGCCMFEMLVGSKLFAAEDYKELFEQHLHTPPPPVRQYVDDCPEALNDIVNQLLAKNPEDRPFNARQVQGVMLRLEEQLDPDGIADRDDPQQVSSRGRAILKAMLNKPAAGIPATEVSWGTLAAMLAAIMALIAAAFFMGR